MPTPKVAGWCPPDLADPAEGLAIAHPAGHPRLGKEMGGLRRLLHALDVDTEREGFVSVPERVRDVLDRDLP